MFKTIWSCWGSSPGRQVHPWVGNELSLILEEKQSKYRYLFRNTLLSPSGDCCHVSDVLIYYLQVALMQDLRIYGWGGWKWQKWQNLFSLYQSNAIGHLPSIIVYRASKDEDSHIFSSDSWFNKAFKAKKLISQKADVTVVNQRRRKSMQLPVSNTEKTWIVQHSRLAL